MIRSNAALAFKYLAVDAAAALLYFPVWWYSRGAARVAVYGAGRVAAAARSFGVGIWLKHLFTPMFGQRDFVSRIISFFVRLAMITCYSVVLLVLAALMAAFFAVWLAAPALVVFEFTIQLSGILKSAQP